uniref:Uncharacterized protein n=1 Tax=Ciona savignyi TaxID=51511 RepID=H2Z5F7_CIOSA
MVQPLIEGELRRKGKDIEVEFDQIEWSDSITEPSAASQLEKLFFPFKQVDYLPFNEAFDRAKTEKKLVHQVLLWGALDDFISTWSLVKDLELLVADKESALHTEAKLSMEAYKFPVQMMVLRPKWDCDFIAKRQ